MGNGFELSKFRTRFLFSDVEFGWDKMWILNWVGTNRKEPRNLEFTRKIGSYFMIAVLKWYYFNLWSFSATSSRL